MESALPVQTSHGQDPTVELASGNFERIRSLLKPFIDEMTERVFRDVGDFIVTECLSSDFDFPEIWVGITDIGLHQGLEVVAVLCVEDDSYNYERKSARDDFISELSIQLARRFPYIDYSDVSAGYAPYEQLPHSPTLVRLEHPDLWKQVYTSSAKQQPPT